jgi:hypothetical protein
MKKVANELGQSTIEFILTFVFGVSLILVVFNTAMNSATGYLVHYATFMASRVYLTADSHIGTVSSVDISLQGSEERARAAFNQYNLGIFNVPDGQFKINPAGNTTPSEYLTVGATTSFEQKMDLLGRITGESKLELVSESFLGKEPTRAVCANRTCFGITGQDDCRNMDITLYDDGC